MEPSFLVFYFVVFAFGLILGSFVNVLIYRIPRNLNVVFPRSSCPSCNKVILWYENIPVFSYLFLKGKCSGCKNKISPLYPSVELIIGVMSLYLFPKILSHESMVFYVFGLSVICVFVAHFFIDLEHEILPNSLNLYLGLIFLTQALIFKSYTFWLYGALIGFFFPLLITWVFYLVRGKVGMGFGDIKLYGVLGLYLGPIGIVHNIFFSSLLGAIVGISLILLRKMDKDKPLPFGPYIIVVAFVQIFLL